MPIPATSNYDSENSKLARTPVYTLEFLDLDNISMYWAEVYVDSPVGYWHLGEESGAVAAIDSAQSAAGTYEGSPTLGETGVLFGDLDTAVGLDGASWVEIEHSDNFNFNSIFTLELWIKPASFGSTQTLLAKEDVGNTTALTWTLKLLTNGKLRLSRGDVWRDSTTEVLGGTFSHVMVAYDTHDPLPVRFYINGEAAGTGATLGLFTPNDEAVLLGRSGAGEFFNGVVDEVAIYNKRLLPDRAFVHFSEAQISHPAKFYTHVLSSCFTSVCSGRQPTPPALIFSASAQMSSGPGSISATSESSLMDLDVIYEVVSRPQQSNSTEARSFNSSMLFFDPEWFDGATSLNFYWDYYATNEGVSDYGILIEDADTDEVLDTITLTGGQPLEWAQVEFTPWVGRRKIRMRLPQTTSGNELQVFALRIRIAQRGASKTRLQFSLQAGHSGAINQFDLTSGDSRFTIGGDTGFVEESGAARFLKEAGGWANVVNWTWESVGGNTGGLGTNTFHYALRNLSSGTNVVVNSHLGENNFTDLQSTDFDHNAEGFTDNVEFAPFSRATSTFANNSLFLRSALYVTLTNLSKFAQYMVTARKQMIESPVVNEGQLVGVAHEMTLTEGSAGTASYALGAAAGGADGDTLTEVSGTSVDPSGAKARYRIEDVALISGQRWYESIGGSGSGSASKQTSFLILKYQRVVG